MLSHFRSDVCNIIADNEFCPLLTVSFDTATLQIALQNFKKKFESSLTSMYVCVKLKSYLGGFDILQPFSSSLNNWA